MTQQENEANDPDETVESEHPVANETKESSCSTSMETISSRRTTIVVVPRKKGERKRIRCEVCVKYPDIIKKLCYRGRIPPICTVTGTEARSETEISHIESDAHKEAVKAERINGLSYKEKVETVPLFKISKAQNKEFADKVGKLITHVYNDAKLLTSSAFSWPSRVVTSEIAQQFDMNAQFEPYVASTFDLQYVSPAGHQELLEAIVKADIPNFQSNIDNCLAVSFRCDASMDRTQKDNEFMLIKTIDKEGNESLRYVGLGFVKGHGAEGHLEALKEGLKDTIGFDKLLEVASHLSTDGENKNVGKNKGLWKLIDNERESKGMKFPMLKSVCAVHSSALAFKDVCKVVKEVDTMLRKLSGISTYFQSSAARTSELEEIAKELDFRVRRLPKYFEIRWAEFAASLIDSILSSWRALISYFERSEEEQAKGFGKLLSNKDNLTLMCFLGDVLFLLKVFQKKLQADDITIVDVVPETTKFIKKLQKLHEGPILGGWEETFKKAFDEEKGIFFEKVLWQKERRQSRMNQFVSETRNFNAIRSEILIAVENFMKNRLVLDDNVKASFSKFVKFTSEKDGICEVHDAVAPDIDLCVLADQYEEVKESSINKKDPKAILRALCTSMQEYDALKTVLARILVCKPHSADCERLISAYSLMKTTSRNRLQRQTISNNLYINLNMPVLGQFDPRPAVHYFMTDKRRRNRDTPKADKQSWFRKVFENQEIENEERENKLVQRSF